TVVYAAVDERRQRKQAGTGGGDRVAERPRGHLADGLAKCDQRSDPAVEVRQRRPGRGGRGPEHVAALAQTVVDVAEGPLLRPVHLAVDAAQRLEEREEAGERDEEEQR